MLKFPPWGRVSAPAGVAPDALEECAHSSKGYECRICMVDRVRQSLSFCLSRPRHSFQPVLAFLSADKVIPAHFGPALGPCEGDQGNPWLSLTTLVALSQGGGVKRTMLPMPGPRAMAASVSCYSVVQEDVRAPFDKGQLTDEKAQQSRRSHRLPRRSYCRVHAWETPRSWDPAVSDGRVYRIECGRFWPWRRIRAS